MVTVADIQKDLPDWPAGVIEPWLIEFANDPGMGWPPPEPYGDHRWGRLLGQRPVSWWKDVTWSSEKADCGFEGLTPKARADVIDIRKEIQGGNPNPATKRRWNNLYRYVVNDGSFPVPPVVMLRPEGLSPIDGTHRMAVLSGLCLIPDAAFAAKNLAKPSNEQTVWMGRHKDRELPNAP
jgi:hypothetical protein